MQAISKIILVAVGVNSAALVALLPKGSWKHGPWKGGVEWNHLVQDGGTSGGLF
jgi:hypothetical protein